MPHRERPKNPHDDDKIWGFMEKDVFVAVPKRPLLRGGLGPPPFEVVLRNGSIRRIIHAPPDNILSKDG